MDAKLVGKIMLVNFRNDCLKDNLSIQTIVEFKITVSDLEYIDSFKPDRIEVTPEDVIFYEGDVVLGAFSHPSLESQKHDVSA